MKQLQKPLSLLAVSAILGFVVASDNPDRIYQLSDLKKVSFAQGSHRITAYVCDTDSKRQEGMMFLTAKEVKNTEGFLFVFPSAAPRSFWMRNTVLPLDIIYLDAAGKVLNIQKGKPYVESGLPSAGNSQYVLELRQGMASKFGIKPGVKLKLPPVRAVQ